MEPLPRILKVLTSVHSTTKTDKTKPHPLCWHSKAMLQSTALLHTPGSSEALPASKTRLKKKKKNSTEKYKGESHMCGSSHRAAELSWSGVEDLNHLGVRDHPLGWGSALTALWDRSTESYLYGPRSRHNTVLPHGTRWSRLLALAWVCNDKAQTPGHFGKAVLQPSSEQSKYNWATAWRPSGHVKLWEDPLRPWVWSCHSNPHYTVSKSSPTPMKCI